MVAQPDHEEAADAAPAPGLVIEELAITGKEKELRESLGAVAAWSAVVDRWRYLARRGDRGLVYGRLGGEADGYRWLIDEAGGGGSLAIRLALPASELRADDRVLVWGAWRVDAERRWFWRVDRVARLPARTREADDPFATAPGHDIGAARWPDGVVDVSAVTESGGAIVFQVVRGPRRIDDGWTIADRSGLDPVAYLVLPGEREPYGGQDMRSDDERWQLERRVSYVLRVRRWRRPRHEGELPHIRALTAPIRVDPRRRPADR